MTRLDRIVLDAVERYGPDATPMYDLVPYIQARHRFLLGRFGAIAAMYRALRRLEREGLVTSRVDIVVTYDEMQANDGGRYRRLYTARTRVTPLEFARQTGEGAH